ncbi:MAG TPA: sugar ABC transporter substrate-binding protein [Chloroflexota bacterium]|nr:sugar ABC transporter substrate-binding protein [Chloroflexota bacterium]
MPHAAAHPTRRHLLATAAVSAAGVLATACGAAATDSAASKSAAPVTISYTDWEPTDGAQIQETVIAEFRAKFPHITVDYQKNVATGYLEKIQTLIVGGTVPDTFALGQPDLIQLTAQSSVADLDAYVKRDAKEVNFADFFKPHAEAWRVGGKLMGLARDGGGVVTFYNKSLFDAQNIRPPAAGYSWDEWLDVARRVTVKDGPSGQIYGAVRNGPADWLHWVWQNGGDILDKDAKRATLEAPEALEALQYHADLVQKHTVMPPPSAYGTGNEDAIGLFMQGKAAMYFGLRSGMQRMRSITGFQLEVMPHPRRKNRLTPLNTTGVILPRGGKHADAAWYLLRHMTSTEGQLKRMEQGGAVPSRDSVSKAPTYLSFRTPAMTSDRINTIFPEMAREGSVRLRPQTPKWNEVLAAANMELNALYTGQASPSDAAKRLTPKLNDLVR